MELVRVDRREVLLGAEAGHVDGVLAVGEDLLVLARFGLALAPRVASVLVVKYALCTTEESAYLLRPLVRFPGVAGSTVISSGQGYRG